MSRQRPFSVLLFITICENASITEAKINYGEIPHSLRLGPQMLLIIHAQEEATIKLSSGCSNEIRKIYLALV